MNPFLQYVQQNYGGKQPGMNYGDGYFNPLGTGVNGNQLSSMSTYARQRNLPDNVFGSGDSWGDQTPW